MGSGSSSDQGAVRYTLAPSIRVSFSAEGATVLDTAKGTIIAMNGSAAELLRAIQDGASFKTLCLVLAGLEAAPSPEIVDAELHTFLKAALGAKFILEHAS